MSRNAIAESIAFDSIPGIDALDLSEGSQAIAAWPGMAFVFQGVDLYSVSGTICGNDSLYGKRLKSQSVTLRSDLSSFNYRQIAAMTATIGQGIEARIDRLPEGDMPSFAMFGVIQLNGVTNQNTNAFLFGAYYTDTSGDGYPFGMYLRKSGENYYFEFRTTASEVNRVPVVISGSGPHIIGFSYDAATKSTRAFFNDSVSDVTLGTTLAIPGNTRLCVGGGVADNISGIVSGWFSTVSLTYGAPHLSDDTWDDWTFMLDLVKARDIAA